jgi:hypothetical protein
MQLELFEFRSIAPPMRMVLDTVDVRIGGKNPAEAIRAIEEAQATLPEGSCDPVIEIRGGNDDLHQVCRLIFRRPPTEEERACHLRYSHPRLQLVAG